MAEENCKSKQSFHDLRYGKGWEPYRSDHPRINRVLELVGSGKKVLDLGCGDGKVSAMLARKGNQVFGLDLSTKAVGLARDKGIEAVVCDLEREEIPFSSESFDNVVAGEIVEHVFDTDAFLEKIRRILKKEGMLILTTPNLASLGRRVALLLGKNPLVEVSCKDRSAGHIRYFVKETLIGLLREHHFEVEYFGADIINFDIHGRLFSVFFAKLFPTLGSRLIVRAKKL